MNRITILIIVLLVTALGILLAYRSQTMEPAGYDAAAIRHHPAAVLDQVDTLLGQARKGAAATEDARSLLQAIIDSGTEPGTALPARRRLAELEQLLGNHEAAGNILLEAIQAHPGSPDIPELLYELAGLLYGELDRPGEAREVLRRIVHLYPDHPLSGKARDMLHLNAFGSGHAAPTVSPAQGDRS